MLLNEALLAALQELVLRYLPIVVGVDHLEIDDERGGLVFRECVALTFGQTPNRLALAFIENCAWTARRRTAFRFLWHRGTGAGIG